MSGAYLQGQALIAACSSGQGVVVIVEGDTPQDDAFYYGQWFGDRAREVSFFPQNGWEKVVNAVSELRKQLPAHRKVFGIIDRDFTSTVEMARQGQQRPGDHVFRTSYFTVENYLLDPEGWLKVVRMLTKGRPPTGWTTPAEVQSKIDDAYRQCMDLAAYNLTIRREYDRSPGNGLEYCKFPKAIRTPEATLLNWGHTRGTPAPLDKELARNQAFIQALPRDDWPVWITGKPTLKIFLEHFAVRGIPHEMLKSMYIDKHPTPPAELTALITRIIERDGAP